VAPSEFTFERKENIFLGCAVQMFVFGFTFVFYSLLEYCKVQKLKTIEEVSLNQYLLSFCLVFIPIIWCMYHLFF